MEYELEVNEKVMAAYIPPGHDDPLGHLPVRALVCSTLYYERGNGLRLPVYFLAPIKSFV